MLETSIENFLNSEVSARGGFTLKLNPLGAKGVPDRLVVLPDRIIFVELKRPKGGVVARLQRWWRKRIADLGHEAVFIKNTAEVLALLDSPPP